MNTQILAQQNPAQRKMPAARIHGLVRSGALAGLAGGAAMAASSMLLASLYRLDVWFQWKAIASLAMGPAALAQFGFAALPVFAGLLIHLAVSVLLGVLIAFASRRLLRLPSDYGAPAVAGLVFGLMLWLLAFFALPAIAPVMAGVYAPAFILQHIVYGTVASMVYATLHPQPYAAEARPAGLAAGAV